MSAPDIMRLPAEEALFLGAAYAHIKAYNHHRRMARIQQQAHMAFRRR